MKRLWTSSFYLCVDLYPFRLTWPIFAYNLAMVGLNAYMFWEVHARVVSVEKARTVLHATLSMLLTRTLIHTVFLRTIVGRHSFGDAIQRALRTRELYSRGDAIASECRPGDCVRCFLPPRHPLERLTLRYHFTLSMYDLTFVWAQMANVLWWFYVSKAIEFLDTVRALLPQRTAFDLF